MRSVFESISAMRLDRDGTMTIELTDGRTVKGAQSRDVFASTSAIASSTHLPHLNLLHLQTVRGDHALIELPRPTDLAPLRGRTTIYLDQNHWSTLTDAVHDPDRVANADELAAARQLIERVLTREIVLPISAGHLSETCKQIDMERRYARALTMTQLSAGWQLRDPLDLRRSELRQVLCARYRLQRIPTRAAVTLEPNAVYAGRHEELDDVAGDLPPEAQWAVHAIRCIGGIIDTMLDSEHVLTPGAPGWVEEFQRFATFLRENPTSIEMKRRRTLAKFLADLAPELAEEAGRANITAAERSDWTLKHSEEDLPSMPALGLFREILHEKLSDGQLRWADNDITDMMYLSAATAYCDYVVGERSHASHITNGLRRLGRPNNMYRNLRSLIAQI
jgi:hypothetical protein